MNKRLVKRGIFEKVARHLKEEEITVITGARQTGKTTLLSQLKEWLVEDQGKDRSQILYFNLDLISDLSSLQDQNDFINFLKEEIENKKFLYIFIDEIQRLKDPGKFLKGIYDLKLPVKIVISGSSSLEIKSKISESLTGRKRVFHLWPFSFEEYLSYCAPDLMKLLRKKDGISKISDKKIMEFFADFAVFGGYPRVVLAAGRKEKIALLDEIYSSYIEKDVVGFMKVKHPLAFSKMVTLIGDQIGGLLNLHEVSGTLGMNFRTVENYIFALENTFVINLARPYFTSARKELTKMPKVYFADNGIRNLAVKYFATFGENRDRGKLLENFVAASIVKKWDRVVNYWRTKDKSEVDFVIRDYNGRITPIEVKATELQKPEITRGLRSFIERYKPRKAFIVNLALQAKVRINGCQVTFTLPYKINLT